MSEFLYFKGIGLRTAFSPVYWPWAWAPGNSIELITVENTLSSPLKEVRVIDLMNSHLTYLKGKEPLKLST